MLIMHLDSTVIVLITVTNFTERINSSSSSEFMITKFSKGHSGVGGQAFVAVVATTAAKSISLRFHTMGDELVSL